MNDNIFSNDKETIGIKKEKILETKEFIHSLNLEKISIKDQNKHIKKIGLNIYFFKIKTGEKEWMLNKIN